MAVQISCLAKTSRRSKTNFKGILLVYFNWIRCKCNIISIDFIFLAPMVFIWLPRFHIKPLRYRVIFLISMSN